MARQSLNELREGSQHLPAPSALLANSSILPVLRQVALQVICHLLLASHIVSLWYSFLFLRIQVYHDHCLLEMVKWMSQDTRVRRYQTSDNYLVTIGEQTSSHGRT